MKNIIMLLAFSYMLFAQTNANISPKDVKYYIEYLASDKLEGRFTGSKGEQLAAEFIQNHYKKIGLKPLFDNSYTQKFDVLTKIELGKNNKLVFKLNNKTIDAKIKEDFIPISLSDNVSFQNQQIVIAGFGISTKEYDNLQNVKFDNKFVIIFDDVPQKFEKNRNVNLDTKTKIKLLIDKGAKNIGIIQAPADKSTKLPQTIKLDMSPVYKNINILKIHPKFIENIFVKANILYDTIYKNYKNSIITEPIELNTITLAESQTELRRIFSKAQNIGCILQNDNSDEYIIIGAHYDHLGWGEFNSLYTGTTPQIHNGADDNASGTAGVMELAEYFGNNPKLSKYNLVFVNFTGEELGLLGSSYFVKNSPIPVHKIKAMINMDMIGRLDSLMELTINGTGTSSIWQNTLDSLNKFYNFKLIKIDDGYSPSDNTSFYSQNIPVLFFFTGIHSDYHRPSDDFDKINFEGQAKILEYIKDLITSLNNKSIDVIITPKKNETKTSFRVYVGTVPDFSYNGQGYKTSNIAKNSPGEKAGLKAGDIIIKFGDIDVMNIYDFTFALSKYNIGDEVEVTFIRDNQQMKTKLMLAGR